MENFAIKPISTAVFPLQLFSGGEYFCKTMKQTFMYLWLSNQTDDPSLIWTNHTRWDISEQEVVVKNSESFHTPLRMK